MDNLPYLIAALVPAIFAVTVHEVAHGWVASRCGDPTAAEQGRLSLNPIKHVDPIGTILIPAIFYLSPVQAFFGWAKPVPVEYEQLRNPRRDIALVAAAGPASNFVMLLGWLAFHYLIQGFAPPASLLYMCKVGIMINAIVMLINLIPIPPLDGSRIIDAMLPDRMAHFYNKLEPWGLAIFVILLLTNVLNRLLNPIFYWVERLT